MYIQVGTIREKRELVFVAKEIDTVTVMKVFAGKKDNNSLRLCAALYTLTYSQGNMSGVAQWREFV